MTILNPDGKTDPPGRSDHARERLDEFLRNRLPQDGSVPAPEKPEGTPQDDEPAPKEDRT